MATVEDFTDPYLETFIPVPPVTDGVCDVCHGAPNPGYTRCWSCERTISQVSRPILRVVPITLAAANRPVYDLLSKYKRPNTVLRRRLRPRVAALLGRFLREHQHCIGHWDVITAVPSSRGRTGTHPLEEAIAAVPPLHVRHRPLLKPGPTPAQHQTASDEAFVVQQPVAGKRVLLVDDTFTSGAAVQSAASALQLAGARLPAAVVMGRYLDPARSPSQAALLSRASQRTFDFARCCLCDAPWSSDRTLRQVPRSG